MTNVDEFAAVMTAITIVVAVVAGVVGGLVGSWWTVRMVLRHGRKAMAREAAAYLAGQADGRNRP
ncbi:hypothetical protein [Microtetraspora malaysiensis]|uniref:Uncharacterized protein n=1 Tax=Microtetraspora malaysiensis TaxID=161358 RepID=A0ABW6SKB4_9ACTN